MATVETTDAAASASRTKRELSNLLNWPVLGNMLRNRAFLPALRILVAAIFFYAIAFGFLHPGKDNLFTRALFWSLFWPFFMVMTLPFVGRVFCSVCPHGAMGTHLQRFSLKLRVPAWLKNPMIGLMLDFLGYWLVLYAFPGVLRSPFFTALYFASFTLLALLTVLIFRKGTWCRYLCPISVPTNLFSRLACMHLTTDRNQCDRCVDISCVSGRGNLMGCPMGINPSRFEAANASTNCTLCLKCVSACSHDAVRISFRPLGSEVTRPIAKPNSWEAWGFVLLFSAMTVVMGLHHGLCRTRIASSLPWVRLGT